MTVVFYLNFKLVFTKNDLVCFFWILIKRVKKNGKFFFKFLIDGCVVIQRNGLLFYTIVSSVCEVYY